MDFLSENWGTITIILIVLIQILNAATRHWKDNTGAVKVLTFLSEIFSILTSRGQVNGSLGKVKAPFTSVNNQEKESTK